MLSDLFWTYVRFTSYVYWALTALLFIVISTISLVTGKRIQWIEIHDHQLCPTFLREALVHSLHKSWNVFGLDYILGSSPLEATVSGLVNKLLPRLKASKHDSITVIDLCSGSGGPTPLIHDYLNKSIPTATILSDLFPNRDIWNVLVQRHKGLSYESRSTDATNISATIDESQFNNTVRLRSLYGAFHHFPPSLAVNIIADAMVCNDGLFIGEGALFRDTFMNFVEWVIYTNLFFPFCLFVNLKRVIWDDLSATLIDRCMNVIKLLAITVVPIFALTNLHDALVSCARLYTADDMMELTRMATARAQQICDKKGITIGKFDSMSWVEPMQPKIIRPLRYISTPGPILFLLIPRQL